MPCQKAALIVMQITRSLPTIFRHSQDTYASLESDIFPNPRKRLNKLLLLAVIISAINLCIWTIWHMVTMLDDTRQLYRVFEQLKQSDREVPIKASNFIYKISNEPLSGDIKEIALQFRIYKRLRTMRESLQDQKKTTVLLEAMTRKLFPWYKSVDLVKEEPVSKAMHQRGIVICTGQRHFSFAVHAIKSIRLWNCSLPIEIFFTGEADLSLEARELFNGMEGVRTVNIEDVVHNNLLDLQGWDVKPFAILGSSFREVILMDADVIFTQNPKVLFHKDEYERDGALFFLDRSFRDRPIDYAQWFHDIIPMPHSDHLKASLMYQGASNHEQESGVVVIDKSRRIYGLLATCLLNSPKEREEIHKKTHGEKETFWLGFEIAEEPYEFYEKQAGLIGVAPEGWDTKSVRMCGHLAHFDKESHLLWFNDAIVANKHRNLIPGNFTHYVNVGKWKGLCKQSPRVKLIPEEQKIMIEKMKELWQVNPLLKM